MCPVAKFLVSTQAVEDEVRLSRATKRYELARSFEHEYTSQYAAVWDVLGPWTDPEHVDAPLRRVVHDLLQALASVYVARELELIERDQARYLFNLFLGWIEANKAQAVWKGIFRIQEDTWPPGFVQFVDAELLAKENKESHMQD